jgi:CDP-diacylglycerol--glycerol-3-phosphate 3-phosphatidyltransferase
MSTPLLQFFSRFITPNQLTLLRIFSIPVLFALVWFGRESHATLLFAWVLFVFSCLTDYWDGVLARHQKSTSKLGKLLDPLADKMLVAALLVVLVEIGRAEGMLVALILMRELAVTGLRSIAAAEGTVIAANSGGKLKTFSQMFAIGFLMIHFPTLWLPCHEIGTLLLWFATGVTVWTGWGYFRDFYAASAAQSS